MNSLAEHVRFVGRKVALLLAVGVACGLALGVIEVAFAYGLQAFLVAIGVLDPAAALMPRWLPPLGLKTVFALIAGIGVVRGALLGLNYYFQGCAYEEFLYAMRSRLLRWSLHSQSASTGEITSLFNARAVGAASAVYSWDRIEAVHQGLLETFRSDERFDVVFAEGFVHFLDDHAAAIRRLLSFTDDEGFVIVSDIDPAGTFVEWIKKCYLAHACAALGLRDAEARLSMAHALFAPEFARINHSRGFDSWAKDMVLNPLYRPRYFLGLPELVAALPEGVEVYSSWPHYLDEDDLFWHKNIQEDASRRQAALDGYFARVPHFLHSIPNPDGRLPLFDPKDGKRVYAALASCYAALDRVAESGKTDARATIAALRKLRASLPADKSSAPARRVVDESAALFTAARAAGTEAALVRAWQASGSLRGLWGSPGHYVALHRTSLFSR